MKASILTLKETCITGRLGISAMAAALLMVGSNQASAHANAIGYTIGANPGEVNLWLGAWHYNGEGDGNDLEGSANLVGVSAPTLPYNQTNPFTFSTPSYGIGVQAPLPAGLVPGTNAFWSPGESPAGTYSWQALTVTGLVAGTYQFNYVPIPNPTQHWTPASGLQGIQITLTAGDVGGGGGNVGGSVPDGGSSALMLGAAVLGIGALRRKLR